MLNYTFSLKGCYFVTPIFGAPTFERLTKQERVREFFENVALKQV
jgi:hypothetical protein